MPLDATGPVWTAREHACGRIWHSVRFPISRNQTHGSAEDRVFAASGQAHRADPTNKGCWLAVRFPRFGRLTRPVVVKGVRIRRLRAQTRAVVVLTRSTPAITTTSRVGTVTQPSTVPITTTVRAPMSRFHTQMAQRSHWSTCWPIELRNRDSGNAPGSNARLSRSLRG
jgi:hypothetical protein